MKVGVIIPDRNDRPEFLKNCLRMLAAQTMQPDIIAIVNDEALNLECDITRRYRIGYDRLRKQNLDCILFIENDDWYSPTYIETMVTEWEKKGKPDLFGTCLTVYYHLKLFAHMIMHHHSRSSAMSTLIVPDMNFEWPVDKEPYTDVWLWNRLKGVVFAPEKTICIGMKHGTGACGGSYHIDRLGQFINEDHDKRYLQSVLDPDSFEFYSTYSK